MTETVLELSIREFTTTPGPRKIVEGEFSGEEFLIKHLRPKFLQAREANGILSVNLDGAAGFPTSFLEEAFGGLAREFGSNTVATSLEVRCADEPYVEDEVKRYIREANKPK